MLNIMEAMGLLTTPQNRAINPTAAAKPGVKAPKEIRATQPKVEPIKKGGDNFTAFESRANGNGSKKNFQRKSFGPALPPMAAVMTSIPGAVISVGDPAEGSAG